MASGGQNFPPLTIKGVNLPMAVRGVGIINRYASVTTLTTASVSPLLASAEQSVDAAPRQAVKALPQDLHGPLQMLYRAILASG